MIKLKGEPTPLEPQNNKNTRQVHVNSGKLLTAYYFSIYTACLITKIKMNLDSIHGLMYVLHLDLWVQTLRN